MAGISGTPASTRGKYALTALTGNGVIEVNLLVTVGCGISIGTNCFMGLLQSDAKDWSTNMFSGSSINTGANIASGCAD